MAKALPVLLARTFAHHYSLLLENQLAFSGYQPLVGVVPASADSVVFSEGVEAREF
jgi:hypothetical protein